MTNFCGCKNSPSIVNVKTFNDMQEKVASTYTHAEDASMKNVANEFVDGEGDSVEDKVADITISNGRSWQNCDYWLITNSK